MDAGFYVYLITTKNIHMQVTKENWLPIQGYEGLYEISDHGRVKTVQKASTDKKERIDFIPEKIRIGSVSKKGYLIFQAWKENKHKGFMVHRLVAMHFLNPPLNPTYNQINHKDGNKKNNHCSNLEWCNNSENQFHRYRVLGQPGCNAGITNHPRSKPKQIIRMDMNGIELETLPSIAEACRKGYTNIHKYLSGERTHASGFKWKYA